MKKITFILLLLSFPCFLAGQQKITGKIVDASNGQSLPFVDIRVEENRSYTLADSDGNFVVEIDQFPVNVKFSLIGYSPLIHTFKDHSDTSIVVPMSAQNIDLEEISILADYASDRFTPVSFTTIKAETIRTKLGDQPLPEILQRSPGVYAARDGGGSGDATLSIRGFKQENIAVLLNGVPINGAENGLVYWNNWLGLAEATASMQVQRGIGASKVALNSVGGTVNILTQHNGQRQGGFASMSTTHYGNSKFTFAYQTGKLQNDWSISLLASHVEGPGYVDATYVDGWAYFLTTSKSFGKKHRIVFSALGGPEKHGQRNLKLSQKEMDLYGYQHNKDWGSYNGEINNASENFYFKPHFSIAHFWNINKSNYLSTSAYYSPGWGGGKWSDSFNYGPAVFDFRNASGQIDWSAIYERNASNTETYTLANGQNVGGYSNLIQTNFLASHSWSGVLSSLETTLGSKTKLISGIHYRYFISSLKQTVDDLLGGQFYIDDYSWSAAGVAGRNQIKYPGDVIRVNNGALLHQTNIFAQIEHRINHVNLFVGGTLSQNAMRRHDVYNYPDDQWSPTVGITGFDLKAGINVNITKTQQIYLNGGHFNKAPYYKFVFGNFSNTPVQKIEKEKVSTIEAGYAIQQANFYLSANAYYTRWNDVSFLSNEYIQLENNQQTRAMVKGLEALHRGIEISILKKFDDWFTAGVVFSAGDWEWKNDVEATLFNDRDVAVDTVKVFANGLKVGGQPQLQTTIFTEIQVLKTFNVGIDYNYFDFHYADFDPAGRQNPVDRAQSFRIPGASEVDMHLQFRPIIKDYQLTIYGSCKNIFDQHRILKGEDGSNHDLETFRGFWSFGRVFDFGIRIEF